MKRKIPNVFETVQHGTRYWIMDGRYHLVKQEDGTFKKGKHERFDTQARAQGRAEQIFNENFQQGVKVDPVAPEIVVDAQRGWKLIQNHPGATILKACEFYASKHQITSKTATEAADEWYTYKEREGHAKASMSNIEKRLKRFKLKFGEKMLTDISHDALHKWLHALPLSTESKIDHRNTVSAFLNWCVIKHKWLEVNPCQGIEFKEDQEKEVKIFAIDEAKRFWNAAKKSDPDIKRYVALTMFCGLRPQAEAIHICREHIGAKEVTVNSHKTKKLRYVHMEPGVRKALASPKWEGNLIGSTFQRRWDLFRYNLGYKVWVNPLYKAFKPDPNYAKRQEMPHDVLRHSYCSYLFAAFENEERCAMQAGHTVPVFRNRYKKSIPKAQGLAFWKIIAS